MNACETWLRRDFLLAQGIHPDEPACTHDPDLCPQLVSVIADLNPPTPEDPHA